MESKAKHGCRNKSSGWILHIRRLRRFFPGFISLDQFSGSLIQCQPQSRQTSLNQALNPTPTQPHRGICRRARLLHSCQRAILQANDRKPKRSIDWTTSLSLTSQGLNPASRAQTTSKRNRATKCLAWSQEQLRVSLETWELAGGCQAFQAVAFCLAWRSDQVAWHSRRQSQRKGLIAVA